MAAEHVDDCGVASVDGLVQRQEESSGEGRVGARVLEEPHNRCVATTARERAVLLPRLKVLIVALAAGCWRR